MSFDLTNILKKKVFFSPLIPILSFMALIPSKTFSQKDLPYWLSLKFDKWVYSSPEIEIIRYDEDYIYINEFDTQIEVGPRNDKTLIENPSMLKANFTIKSENLLLGEYSFTDENGKSVVYTSNYVKLYPTIIKDDDFEATNITSSEYVGAFNGIENKISFNKKIQIDDIPHLFQDHILGDVLKLEEFDGIYFLSFYQDNERNHVIPIYEISNKGLTVYGINEENDMVNLTKL